MTWGKLGEKGQILGLSLIVLSLILIGTVTVSGGALIFSKDTSYSVGVAQALNLAEAGVDKAVASINSSGGTYSGETETFLGPGSFSVTVTSVNPTANLVQATGYVPNKSSVKFQKTVSIQVSKGVGSSFYYGIQVGNGGLIMGNSALINGSVYSNWNISGGNNNTVNSDVYVAGGTQPTADQQSDCVTPNCSDFLFGLSVSGNNRQDVAQSFQPSSTGVLNKVSIKLKKIGSPSNPTVQLMSDKSGSPDKNGVLASATLSSSLVTTNYGFIDVAFSSTVNVTANTTYWIMIHASSLDSSNYWAWSEDTLQGYTRGSPVWSANWQAGNPIWTTILADLGFQTYMGGVSTSISLGNGSVVGGSVHANTISGITINGNAYYQVITNTTVKGTSYPGSPDPPPIANPISDANIASWETQAQQAGVTVGDIIGCPATLGPGEIQGNVSLNNNCSVTVKSPVWISGTLTGGNSTIFNLDPSLGASSGMIIVNGAVSLGNGDSFNGSGTSGSYLMLLSNYNSTTSLLPAITTGGGAMNGVIYAPYGLVNIPNNVGSTSSFQELSAWEISLGNSAVINYQTGLSSVFFSSGPSGSFSVIKGTYQILH